MIELIDAAREWLTTDRAITIGIFIGLGVSLATIAHIWPGDQDL